MTVVIMIMIIIRSRERPTPPPPKGSAGTLVLGKGSTGARIAGDSRNVSPPPRLRFHPEKVPPGPRQAAASGPRYNISRNRGPGGTFHNVLPGTIRAPMEPFFHRGPGGTFHAIFAFPRKVPPGPRRNRTSEKYIFAKVPPGPRCSEFAPKRFLRGPFCQCSTGAPAPLFRKRFRRGPDGPRWNLFLFHRGPDCVTVCLRPCCPPASEDLRNNFVHFSHTYQIACSPTEYTRHQRHLPVSHLPHP